MPASGTLRHLNLVINSITLGLVTVLTLSGLTYALMIRYQPNDPFGSIEHMMRTTDYTSVLGYVHGVTSLLLFVQLAFVSIIINAVYSYLRWTRIFCLLLLIILLLDNITTGAHRAFSYPVFTFRPTETTVNFIPSWLQHSLASYAMFGLSIILVALCSSPTLSNRTIIWLRLCMVPLVVISLAVSFDLIMDIWALTH